MFVCVQCNRQMRPKKNGYEFIELAGDRPYKLWSGDLWECQECGQQIVHTDPRQSPLAEHYQPIFDDLSTGVTTTAKEWSRK
jgi:hypothetical protein